MPEEFPIQDLKATEAALAALAPTPAALDRDHLMFQAGRAARPGPSWGWPAATGILAAVAATLALVMVTQPPVVTETVVVRVPVEPAPAPIAPTTSETPADSPLVAFQPTEVETGPLTSPGYLQLQEQILRWGLDALPSGPPTTLAEPPLTLEKLLGESPKRPVDNSPWWKLDQFIPIGGQS